jgi:phosphoserine phosphatase
MTPVVREGVVQAELDGIATYRDGKMQRLRQRSSAPLLAALGDSRYDAAMLRAASVPIAVHPNPGLVAELAGLAGVIVIGE